MKFDLKEINQLSDPSQDYSNDITLSLSLDDLKKTMADWKPLAKDAYEIVMRMNEEDFEEFTEGMKLERRGKFAGLDWGDRYAEVLMPSVMFVVTQYSTQYKAPWGLVYIRMREQGMIIERDGIAFLRERKQ